MATHPSSPPPEASDNVRRRFGELATEHHFRIRNYLRSIGVASSSVDDVAQEALLIAYRRFDTYKEGSNFPVWVNTIARNLVWNDRRKTSRRYKLLNAMVTESIIEQDPFEHLAERDQANVRQSALRRCLGELSDKNRTLLKARYQHEMTVKEVAEQHGILAGTLRKHMLRIRQTLRACINEVLKGHCA